MKPFKRNEFYFDIDFYVKMSVTKVANGFINDRDHILNSCYETFRNSFRMPKCKTVRFLSSFIPFSVQVLNGVNMSG